MSTNRSLSDTDLHAYVDGHLSAERHAEVEAYLATSPADAQRVLAYRRQSEALHAMFDPVLDEPVPASMHRIPHHKPPYLRYAAAVAIALTSGVIGWWLRGGAGAADDRLAHQAAVAYAVYTPDVNHPVEVPADHESHLVAWLSKRLGTRIEAPRFAEHGYELVGGRLLAVDSGPAAMFMYQNTSGNRLTLLVRTVIKDNHDTAFRYAREGRVGVFYWIDGSVAYALSSEGDKDELLALANAAHRQLKF